jgi:hypothetical protein
MRRQAYALLREYQRRTQTGKPAPDPFTSPRERERPELERLGLRRTKSGKLVERRKR